MLIVQCKHDIDMIINHISLSSHVDFIIEAAFLGKNGLLELQMIPAYCVRYAKLIIFCY